MSSRRPALRLAALAAVVAVVLLGLPGCTKTQDVVGPDRVYTVVYRIGLSGSGTLVQFGYDAGNGTVVIVPNPVPGWNTTIYVAPGSVVYAKVQAGLSSGTVSVDVDARDGAGHVVTRHAECSGTTTECSAEIRAETLP